MTVNHPQGDCDKHRQPLTVYCDEKECQVMVCPSCIVTKHRNHNCIDIPEKAEEIKKHLAELRENSQDIKDVFHEQITTLTGVMEKINMTASTTLDNLDDTRDFLYQQVKEGIEAYKAQVIQTQQKNLKEVREAIHDIEKRRAGIEQCYQLTDQFINHDNPTEVIQSSELIISNYNDAVKQNEREKCITSFEMASFLPKKYNNFKDEFLGPLVTNTENIQMPGVLAGRMPIQGTLVRSWGVNGHTVTIGQRGEIYVCAKENDSWYLKLYDLDGNVKMSVDLVIPKSQEVRNMACTKINGVSMLVLTANKSIQIRHSHNGQLIDSLTFSTFAPSFNALCMTPNNTILMANHSGVAPCKVIECEVKNMKIVGTKRVFNLDVQWIHGLCSITHEGRQLVIATSFGSKAVVAIDYHTGETVWTIDQPSCDGTAITPMGITSDGEGHLLISDHDNKRVLLMTHDGKIHRTLLQNKHAALFWHQGWIPQQRKLVVRDQMRRLYVYDMKYE